MPSRLPGTAGNGAAGWRHKGLGEGVGREGRLQPCPAPSWAPELSLQLTLHTATGAWHELVGICTSQNPWDSAGQFCNQTHHQPDEGSGQVLVGITVDQLRLRKLSKRHHVFSTITCPCSFTPCSPLSGTHPTRFPPSGL